MHTIEYYTDIKIKRRVYIHWYVIIPKMYFKWNNNINNCPERIQQSVRKIIYVYLVINT